MRTVAAGRMFGGLRAGALRIGFHGNRGSDLGSTNGAIAMKEKTVRLGVEMEADAVELEAAPVSEDEARRLLEAGFPKAERLLEDGDKLEETLLRLEGKMREVPALGEMLADVPLLVLMIRDYAGGVYKFAPVGSILAAVSAILYVVAPVDFIPDVVPGVGFVDDAAVVAFCMKLIHSDVEDYRVWKFGSSGSVD